MPVDYVKDFEDYKAQRRLPTAPKDYLNDFDPDSYEVFQNFFGLRFRDVSWSVEKNSPNFEQEFKERTNEVIDVARGYANKQTPEKKQELLFGHYKYNKAQVWRSIKGEPSVSCPITHIMIHEPLLAIALISFAVGTMLPIVGFARRFLKGHEAEVAGAGVALVALLVAVSAINNYKKHNATAQEMREKYPEGFISELIKERDDQLALYERISEEKKKSPSR